MILLDTNVISELMREAPDGRVLGWIDMKNPIHLGITAIAIAEILRGLARLPTGKRRSGLESRFTAFVTEGFGDRIYSFDRGAAERSTAKSPLSARSKASTPTRWIS